MGHSSRRMWPLVAILGCVVLSSASTATAVPAEQTGTTEKAPPIIGGQPASITEHPWVVYLAEDQGARQFCGGTVAEPDKIVTAAHCVRDRQPQDVDVVAGREDTRTQEGTVAGVTDIWLHPDFQRPESGADVAVLTLDQRLDQQPLQLASEQDAALYTPGAEATVLGWGATEEGGSPSTLLRKVTVPISSDEDCSRAYGSEYVPEAMVCAGEPEGGMDACQGDSGGPLVVRDKLVGIVSFGRGCARPDTPGVYTRVATYEEEIRAQLAS